MKKLFFAPILFLAGNAMAAATLWRSPFILLSTSDTWTATQNFSTITVKDLTVTSTFTLSGTTFCINNNVCFVFPSSAPASVGTHWIITANVGKFYYVSFGGDGGGSGGGGGGGSASLAVGQGSLVDFLQISSPTTHINFSTGDFTVNLVSPSTAVVKADFTRFLNSTNTFVASPTIGSTMTVKGISNSISFSVLAGTTDLQEVSASSISMKFDRTILASTSASSNNGYAFNGFPTIGMFSNGNSLNFWHGGSAMTFSAGTLSLSLLSASNVGTIAAPNISLGFNLGYITRLISGELSIGYALAEKLRISSTGSNSVAFGGIEPRGAGVHISTIATNQDILLVSSDTNKLQVRGASVTAGAPLFSQSTFTVTSTITWANQNLVSLGTQTWAVGDHLGVLAVTDDKIYLGKVGDGGTAGGTTIVSGASALAITTGSIEAGYVNTISSPSNFLIFSSAAFTGVPLGGLGTTSFINLNYSSVTAQGKIDIAALYTAINSTFAQANVHSSTAQVVDVALYTGINSTYTAFQVHRATADQVDVALYTGINSTYTAFQVHRATADQVAAALYTGVNSTFTSANVHSSTAQVRIAGLSLATTTIQQSLSDAPILSTTPYRMISLSAGYMMGVYPSSASRENSGFAVNKSSTGWNATGSILQRFNAPNSTRSFAEGYVGMPCSWDGSTISAQFIWQADTGEANTNVFWSIGAVALSSGTNGYQAVTSTVSVESTFVSSGTTIWSNQTPALQVLGSPGPCTPIKVVVSAFGGAFRGLPLLEEVRIWYREAIWDGKLR